MTESGFKHLPENYSVLVLIERLINAWHQNKYKTYIKKICTLRLPVYWKEFQTQISLNKIEFYLITIFTNAYLVINYICK